MSTRAARPVPSRGRLLRKAATGLLATLVALTAVPAGAVEIFINNVKVTGALRNQDLAIRKIRFADNGDLYIDAPDYKIETAEPGAPATPPPPTAQGVALKNRIWMVVNNVAVGHYTIKTRLNGQPLADVPPERPQYVLDVTDKMSAGNNRLTVTFLPVPNAPPVPTTEAVSVMVGMGDQAADGTLTIGRLLGTVKRDTGSPSAEERNIEFTMSVQ